MLQAAGCTHPGNRSRNEDAFLINAAQGLFIIADGVGGESAGDVAAELTCQIINQRVTSGESLQQSIGAAHTSVAGAAEVLGTGRMGSTVVALRVVNQQCTLAWVGDSRAYLWDGTLKLLSRDHSHVQALYESGLIPYEAMSEHPQKHLLAQALGVGRCSLKVGLNQGVLSKGQIYLLCSDGLSDAVSGLELATELKQTGDMETLASKLIQTAVTNGARDNCSCICIKVDESPPWDSPTVGPFTIFATFNARRRCFVPGH